MFAVRLLFFICWVLLWKPCDSYYEVGTNERQIAKIIYLARELVKDAEMKIASIQFFRDQYYKSLVYQLGEMVYQMRNKFKMMVYMYQQTHMNLHFKVEKNNENIQTLVTVYHMSMEVDNMAQMMEMFENKRETKQRFHERMSSALRRSGREADMDRKIMQQLRRLDARSWGAYDVAADRPAPPPLAEKTPRGNKKNKKWRAISFNEFE